MRHLTQHKVNGLNQQLGIVVVDAPSYEASANHEYEVHFPDGKKVNIDFQKGPIKIHGVNGVTNEALLAILIDRMRGFQASILACEENSKALHAMEEALMWLNKRTRDRIERGVEGTNQQ